MRTFEKTHPWLKFEWDLRPISHRTWVLLGEAKSKCDHIAGVPLRPDTERDLHRLYLAKGVLATTAIEGNTLTEEEVLKHLEKKLHLPPSKAYLGQEVDNIAFACTSIANQIARDRQTVLTVDMIREFNRFVLKDLSLEEGVVAGEVRRIKVGVGRYGAVDPQDCEYLLGKLCEFLAADLSDLSVDRVVVGIIKAVLGHVYFELIHPFADGNGRTGRLIEFFLLLSSGVPSPAAHLLSNFYNQTRAEYYRQLQYISQAGGDVFRFVDYAIGGFVDGLKEQLARIQSQQLDIMWRNYVHEVFREHASVTGKRRRDLALAISTYTISTNEFITPDKLLGMNAKVAAAYAKKTKKTLQRDLNALEKTNLFEISDKGMRAKAERLLAFQPFRLEEQD